MIVRRFLVLAGFSMASCALQAETLLLTGEVFSRQAQEIIVPLTTNWNVAISKMAPEGSYVDAGDVVVQFDGTAAARQLEQQEETARGEEAKTKRDVARLDKELVQARFRYQQAVVGEGLARMKAETPEDFIGALEYAENQLAHERAIKEVDDASNHLEGREKALRDRRQEAGLEKQKQKVVRDWWENTLGNYTITAQQPGYMIYGQHPWTRAKFQEGDNVQASFKIAQVANTDDLSILVYINSVDRPEVSVGQAVTITMDALPQHPMRGEIESVSDSSSKRQEWGKAAYFEMVVSFEGAGDISLLPGMSALVEVAL